MQYIIQKINYLLLIGDEYDKNLNNILINKTSEKLISFYKDNTIIHINTIIGKTLNDNYRKV